MSIKLKSIQQVFDLLNQLDGWGIIFEDEELVLEKLQEDYDLIDDYTPPLRKEYLDYLKNHKDLNSIINLAEAQYNTDSLDDLSFADLKEYAEEWGY